MRNTHSLALSLVGGLFFPHVMMAQTTAQPESAQLANTRPVFTAITSADKTPSAVNVNEQDLIANPELLAQFLDKAVESNQWQAVAVFLPMYEKIAQPDRTLLEYARAGLLRSQGQYAKAIELYRGIVSRQPELTPVRMALAVALFENHQDEAASFQLEKVRVDNPPVPVATIVEQYLSEIRKRSGWRVDGGINYVSDNNINNASTDRYVKIGSFVLPRTADSLPQSGQGAAYFANLARDFNLRGQHALISSVSINGKNYWNNHAYDDLQGRVNIGYKWQDARTTVAIAPFFQVRRFGNDAYSHGYGARIEGSYLLNPHWQVAAATEWTKSNYAVRQFLNGDSLFGSFSASYAPNAQTVLFGGVDVLNDSTREASESSVRKTARLGWVQDLPFNLSFRAQASIGRRVFKDAPSLFGMQRKDNELNYSLTLWHRRLYFWGIMPKLTWAHEQVKSSVGIANYKKDRVFLSLDKRF